MCCPLKLHCKCSVCDILDVERERERRLAIVILRKKIFAAYTALQQPPVSGDIIRISMSIMR